MTLFSALRGEDTFMCRICEGLFTRVVWHCPDDEYHNHLELDAECGNCHRSRIAIFRMKGWRKDQLFTPHERRRALAEARRIAKSGRAIG